MQRIVIVGMGKIGLLHASVLNVLPDVEIVALCDLDPKLGSHVKSIGLNAPFFPSLDEALEKVEADSVYVCTPQFGHRSVAETGIRRGLHVFVEKPIAHTLDDARHLYDLVRQRTDLVHAVGYMKAHYPLYQEVRSIITDGILGTVKHFRASLYLSQVFSEKTGWIYNPSRSGGGIVVNSACHLLYLLYLWFGELGGVYAKATRLHSKSVEDTTTALFEFRNGVVGAMHTSWSLPGFQVEETEVLVEGTNGLIIANDNQFRLYLLARQDAYPQGWTVRHRSETDLTPFNLSPEYGGEGYYNEDLDFVQSCTQSRSARVTWFDGLQVQKMIDAIYRSSDEGYISIPSSESN